MRETLEETGFAAELLAVGIPTLATRPTRVGAEDVDSLGGGGLVTEPIAVTQRMTDGEIEDYFLVCCAGGFDVVAGGRHAAGGRGL